MNIPFDSEKEVYTAMFEELTSAIEELTEKAENGVNVMGAYDAVYAGDATKWVKYHLISFIKENGGIEYAVQTMNVYKQKAFDLLASLPESDICAALRAYLDYVVDREK